MNTIVVIERGGDGDGERIVYLNFKNLIFNIENGISFVNTLLREKEKEKLTRICLFI